jgi:hypothetical protein
MSDEKALRLTPEDVQVIEAVLHGFADPASAPFSGDINNTIDALVQDWKFLHKENKAARASWSTLIQDWKLLDMENEELREEIDMLRKLMEGEYGRYAEDEWLEPEEEL